MTETRLVAKLRQGILARYPTAFIFKVHGGPYQEAGIPDLVACIEGRFVGIEVKEKKQGESVQAAYGRATPLQLRQIELIEQAGGSAGVAISLEDCLEIIEQAIRT